MKKIIFTSFILLSILLANNVYASTPPDVTANPGGSATANTPANPPANSNSGQKLTPLQNPLKVDSVKDVIFLAVDIAIYLGTAFAVLALIFVGFQFIAAQGNQNKLIDAKRWFFSVIIGFAVLISAKVIVEIVKNTLVDSGVVNKGVFEVTK